MGYEYDSMDDAACEMAINEGYAWDEKLKVWYEWWTTETLEEAI